MFDRIAPRYDRLNRLLSLGSDLSWRSRALDHAMLGERQIALDIGVGTGDLAVGLLAAAPASASVIGLDLSSRMLAISRRRLVGYGDRYRALLASAEDIPLADASVDRIISGFTVRNIADLPRAFGEMGRVLRSGGRVVILELSHPPFAPFRLLYRWYFEQLAPPFAMLFGGDPDAYRYLPRSLRAFPKAERVAELMSAARLRDVRFERLTMGIATVHTATAP